jgi:hypothetical protein
MLAAMCPAAATASMTPLPAGATIPPGTLRAEMEQRRAAGERYSIKEAIALVVPICTQLASLHAEGATLFVHPSGLRVAASGVEVDPSAPAPVLPRDKACLAPEQRKGTPGDGRASVFALGAMLYELLTGASVGPGMRRPTEVVPDLPPALEGLLGKALVADPKHRPGDLGALAQALHSVAPNASIAPPAADVSHLDHDQDFDVDVSLSMIPPPPKAPGSGDALPPPPSMPKGIAAVQGDGPFAVAIRAEVPSQRNHDPTHRLAEMKAALEADPRPRYVVVKDGMDHGPFSAVELLQQIASGSFVGEHALRDAFSGEERLILDWEEFAPFAEQAKLNRAIVEEKKAFEAVVVAEKKGSQTKALIGATIVGVLVAGLAGLWYRQHANHEKEITVQADTAVAVSVDGGLGAAKPGAHGGGFVGGGHAPGGGSYPVLAGGMSCEAAQARYVEEYKMGNNGPPDLTAGAYGAVLNKGSYLNACGVPPTMAVNVCAAVQNGRAVGVTVTTNPPDRGIASCVAAQVRGLPFPSHPRLDVARTSFAAQ